MIGGGGGKGGADLVANNLAQACAYFISHSGSCADRGHPSRLSHAYHASSLTESRAPIPCLIQKLWHLHETTSMVSSSLRCNISVADHDLQDCGTCKVMLRHVHVCRHVLGIHPMYLHDYTVFAVADAV